MPTVIDSLVVELALDPRKYTAGQREALQAFAATKEQAASTAKEMEARGSQAAEFFGQIQNKVLGLAAAYVGLGAVKSSIVDVTNATAELGRVAQITGANAQFLDAFGKAIERNGGNAAAATHQVAGFIQQIERFKLLGQASPELQMFLGTVGAGANDSFLDIMKKFADYAEKNRNNPAQVTAIAGMAGITDPATITELMKGRTGLTADLERSRQLGVATKEQIEAARNLQTSFVSLEQAVDTVTRDLLTEFGPTLIRILNAITKSISIRGDQMSNIGAAGGATVGMLAGGPIGAAAGTVIGGFAGAVTARSSSALGKQIQSQIDATGGFVDPLTGSWIPVDSSPSSSLEGALGIIKRLEASKTGDVSSAGAIGEYQILPTTAQQYGLDPSKLTDPVYNKYAASVILSDLIRTYHGNMDAVAIAYHSGKGAANAYLASGGNTDVLGPKGRDYLAREQRMTQAGSSSVNIGTINVVTQASDARGIARDLRGAISDTAIANQANTGLQ